VRPAQIGEIEFAAIAEELAPVSESYLRRLVRESGVSLATMLEGVRQDSFESLERTLLALLDEYERGDAARRMEVRRRVIESKDHARRAASRFAPSRNPVKDEMVLWMLTWLENPSLFRQWLALRKRATGPIQHGDS
jgi:hypothetical protein